MQSPRAHAFEDREIAHVPERLVRRLSMIASMLTIKRKRFEVFDVGSGRAPAVMRLW